MGTSGITRTRTLVAGALAVPIVLGSLVFANAATDEADDSGSNSGSTSDSNGGSPAGELVPAMEAATSGSTASKPTPDGAADEQAAEVGPAQETSGSVRSRPAR